jgi:hypothetical protein
VLHHANLTLLSLPHGNDAKTVSTSEPPALFDVAIITLGSAEGLVSDFG